MNLFSTVILFHYVVLQSLLQRAVGNVRRTSRDAITPVNMPLGIQRLNAKKTQPNDRVIFIKPLKGKDESIAQDFLERIAAQCRMYQSQVPTQPIHNLLTVSQQSPHHERTPSISHNTRRV